MLNTRNIPLQGWLLLWLSHGLHDVLFPSCVGSVLYKCDSQIYYTI